MKIYFLSSRQCALTFNDVYFGVTDNFERFAEISLKDNIYVRFQPENALPIGFFLNEQIRFSPPDGCEVYLLKDAIAIYARRFPPLDFTLKTIAQARENDCLATLFQQGQTQLSIQSIEDFSVCAVDESFARGELFFAENLICLKTENRLALYTKKGACVFDERTLDFQIENGQLRVKLPLCEILGRIADCTYALSADACTRTGFTLQQARTQNGTTDEREIAKELLPYAFFESVLIGANYQDMLGDDLKDKAQALRDFLGEFVAVSPTQTPNVCALVRKKSERLFTLSYFTVEIKDGKITEIKG